MHIKSKNKKHFLIVLITILTTCLSFKKTAPPGTVAAKYYDLQNDKLLYELSKFSKYVTGNKTTDSLKIEFFRCREAYKTIEMFVDVFAPFKARIINGPDLLKIDEENPSDSMKPHGFQVMESILFGDNPDLNLLKVEINQLILTIRLLRNEPDRQYYFTDTRIWRAMRLGIYRIISMGVTGFDVPLSYHALPEIRSVLKSVQKVAGLYQHQIPDTVFNKGTILFKKTDTYLLRHNDFNTFDRLYFIRECINPLSAWLTNCALATGRINTTERSPLNPEAEHLFAGNIMNITFFSPNENYLVTPERIALGKQLFHDNMLSGDNSRSCATCHMPEKAFTDGVAKQMGMKGDKLLLRNTPTLWNAALQTAQFYDSRTKKLENQLSAVVHNTDEMNGSLRNSIPRLRAKKIYDSMFAAAYPTESATITEYNIANAISSYIRSLISLSSRFDKYMRHETEQFTKSEQNGFNLFMGKAKCGTCHYAPLFNGLTPPLYEENESETIAVPANNDSLSELDKDPGRFNFTHLDFHKSSFKTTSLRNIALTPPYMHNGVFADLMAVINFYNDGGGAGRGIELATQTLPAEKLQLKEKEKLELIAFLNTLTDTTNETWTRYYSK